MHLFANIKIGNPGHQFLEDFADVRWVRPLPALASAAFRNNLGTLCVAATTPLCQDYRVSASKLRKPLAWTLAVEVDKRCARVEFCLEFLKRSACSRPNFCSGAAARAGAGPAPLRSGAAAEAAVATAAGSGGVAAGAGVGAAAAATMGEKRLSCPETLFLPCVWRRPKLANPPRPPAVYARKERRAAREPASLWPIGSPQETREPHASAQKLEKEPAIRFDSIRFDSAVRALTRRPSKDRVWRC